MVALLLAVLLPVPTAVDDPPSTPVQQVAPPLRLEVRPNGTAVVHLGDLMSDASLREALETGLPIRIEIVTRLWNDGFFDSEEGRSHWHATIVHDPLGQEYVTTIGREAPVERRYSSLAALRDDFGRRLDAGLQPVEEGRYYYLSRMEVETLSLSDLEELRRWLSGDLAEAITGGDVEGAVQRGLRRTVTRLLGMPTRRYEARSETFEFSGTQPSAP